VQLVAQLEREACQLAELTLAVSPADASAVERLGARRVLLASNGIDATSANPAVVEQWRRRLGGKRVGLFVGSGHPPNAAGFIHALGDALGFVPPDACLVAAGRMGEALTAHYATTRFPTLNTGRLHITGELDDEGLSAIKALASLYLLPIFEGGGSNIKTSEAILSGRPIIATSVSLRGFERYLSLPELTVADDRQAWVRSVREAFLRAETPAAPVDALRSALLWSETLSSVAPAVRALVN
jgi:glycosyltransferase involved in cell wall biosynthesis